MNESPTHIYMECVECRNFFNMDREVRVPGSMWDCIGCGRMVYHYYSGDGSIMATPIKHFVKVRMITHE